MPIISIFTPRERKPGPAPADRVCTDPQCETVLSTWNEADCCALHGGWPVQSLRMDHNCFGLDELMDAAA